MTVGQAHPGHKDMVLYEVYVRSFADSDGDGIGDLRGITSRLGYLENLGVNAIWLTPIFRSPQFDFGYDVSDYYSIHKEYGTLEDMDELIESAHRLGIEIYIDIILSHTSIEHPWFREAPEHYIWAKSVPNNWLSVFGGSAWAWSERHQSYYYHRYYAEQPNLNWNSPFVRDAMHDVIRFWIERGVDGFRLDSLDGLAIDPELRDEPPIAGGPTEGREYDTWADYWRLDHIYTSNLPQVVAEVRSLRRRFPETAFVVEADLPRQQLLPYMSAGASAFAFDFMRAPLDGNALAAIVDSAGNSNYFAWALSNHDQPRLVSRWGRELAGVAAVFLLTLPGIACIYQGDEIGMIDGAGGPVVFDRSGRDAVRHPMQWTPDGGFTVGTPWLPMTDPDICNVADQMGVADSMLETYRRLIGLRRQITGPVEVLFHNGYRLAFRRSSTIVELNLSEEPVEMIARQGADVFRSGSGGGRVLGGRSAAIMIDN